MRDDYQASRTIPGWNASKGGGANEGGSALLLTMALVMMLGSLAAGLVLMIGAEIEISRHHQVSVRLRYAAEAGIELGVQRLRRTDVWSRALAVGGATSRAPFHDRRAGTTWSILEEHRLSVLAGASRDVGVRVLTWVADDEESDGDPLTDSNNRVLLRAEAYGVPTGRHVIRAVVTRHAGDGPDAAMHVLSWHADRD